MGELLKIVKNFERLNAVVFFAFSCAIEYNILQCIYRHYV